MEGSELEAVLQVWPHQRWIERKYHLPWPADSIPPASAQDIISLLPYMGKGLAFVQLGVLQGLQVLSSWLAPSLYWCLGLLLSRYGALDFSFLNIVLFLSAYFFSLSRSLWMAPQPSGMSVTPPSLMSPANFLRVHSAPPFRCYMTLFCLQLL